MRNERYSTKRGLEGMKVSLWMSRRPSLLFAATRVHTNQMSEQRGSTMWMSFGRGRNHANFIHNN